MHRIEQYLDKILPKALRPFKDIIWFVILFLTFDFLWKLFVRHGDDEAALFVLGKDLTSYTHGISLWTAKAVRWVVNSLLGYEDFSRNGITLFFNKDESLPIDIIWGCTGLKQLFMFTFIITFYFGPKKKKLWFIPLSLFVLTAINILRLSIICIIVRDPFPEWFIHVNEWYNNRTWTNSEACHKQFYIDWFNIFHRDIFTWLYYDGVMLLIWLFWEEKINKPYQRLKQKNTVKQINV